MKSNLSSENTPSGREILLVEDSIDVRYFAVDVLEGAGHRVTALSLGEEAIQVATKSRFDLILMDISLPDMTGFEVTKAIRAAELANGQVRTQIVAFTSHTSKSHRARAVAVGMDGYLTKPISPEVLLAAAEQRSDSEVVVENPAEEQNVRVSPLVAGYLKRVRDNGSAASTHLADGRWDQVTMIGHNLKGTGGTYGFDDLSDLGVRLEAAARDRDTAHTEAILEELKGWLASSERG